MKRKVIKDENIGGVRTVIETVEQTREDGLVSERELHEISQDKIGKYHYGVSKHTTITTNNTNVTRFFAYGILGFFLILGLVLLLLKIYVGVIPVMFAILGFIIAKRDINEIEEEIRKQGGNVIRENAKEDVKEYVETVKDGFEDSCKSTFTKENFKWFSKMCTIIMSIIIPVISVVIGFIAGVKVGIFIFGICTFGTILYLFLVSKICKH